MSESRSGRQEGYPSGSTERRSEESVSAADSRSRTLRDAESPSSRSVAWVLAWWSASRAWSQRHALVLPITGTLVALGLLATWEADQLSQSRPAGVLPVVKAVDPLFLSGCLAALLGLWLARGRRTRFDSMLGSLRDRRTLVPASDSTGRGRLSDGHWALLIANIRRLEKNSSRVLATLIGIVIAALFVWAGTKDEGAIAVLGGPLVGLVGGVLVGYPLGRMVSYGLLSRSLGTANASLRPHRAHVDGAGGLRPLGHYFVSQTWLLLLPAVFLLVWTTILFIPYWQGHSAPCAAGSPPAKTSVSTIASCVGQHYASWRWPYVGLSLVAIALSILVSLPALLRAHRDMGAERDRQIHEADEAYSEAASRAQGSSHEKDRAASLETELASSAERWREAESMPTWPFDSSLKRRILGIGALIATPLVTQMVSAVVKNFSPK
jgi:hypothetical protein